MTSVPGTDPDAGRRTYLFYRPHDFLLYVFSLSIVAAGAWFAFPSFWARSAFAIALCFMAITFVMKRGIAFDGETIELVFVGVISYPVNVLRRVWSMRRSRILRLVVLVAAIGLELALARTLSPSSFWLRPFPYVACFVAMFSIVSLYRTVILVAHLSHWTLVRATLADSNWKRELKSLSTATHLVHAYVTGLISHACALVPAMIFWRLTKPTYAREALLFGFFLFTLGREGRRYLKRFAIGFSPRNWLVAMSRVSLGLSPEVVTSLYGIHENDHKSRFNFTVFHGHHHDAIPSSLMAALDTGFVEAIDRGIWLGSYLNSTIATMLLSAQSSWTDMVLHQYIPGIYPYSRLIVDTQAHHVAHHYGSLMPLGLGGLPSYKADLDNGYHPGNARVRWYLDIVKKSETFSEESYDKFVQLDIDARMRDLAYMGFTDTPGART